MQMIRKPLILFCALALGRVEGSISKRRSSLRQPAAQEVIAVVPVPVVTVEVFEEPSTNDSDAGGLSGACMAEVKEIESDQQRIKLAERCEMQTGLTEDAISSLRRADKDEALALVKKSFQECANLTAACSGEIAPEVVLQMRLSGVAVETVCMDAAAELQQQAPTQEQLNCHSNASEALVSHLMKQDIEGAILAAEEGLRSCDKMKSPCDFQLAPVVVVQLLQASQQPQAAAEKNIVEVLLAGARKPEVAKTKAVVNSTKRLSLLATAEEMRRTSARKVLES